MLLLLSLFFYFTSESTIFPHPAASTVQISWSGIKTMGARLKNGLTKMADFWDEEIEAMLDALTSLIEPFLIVFLGVVVGGIVIAMFLPIFKLNDIVSGGK